MSLRHSLALSAAAMAITGVLLAAPAHADHFGVGINLGLAPAPPVVVAPPAYAPPPYYRYAPSYPYYYAPAIPYYYPPEPSLGFYWNGYEDHHNWDRHHRDHHGRP